MGWYSDYWVKGTKMQDWIKQEFSYQTEQEMQTVEFISKRGFSCWFIGLHQVNKATGLNAYFPVVMLTHFTKDTSGIGIQFQYKVIEETSGPAQLANKPFLEWIDKNCGEPENEWAKNWREKSRKAKI